MNKNKKYVISFLDKEGNEIKSEGYYSNNIKNAKKDAEHYLSTCRNADIVKVKVLTFKIN